MNYLYNKLISSNLHPSFYHLAVQGYDKIITRQVRHSTSHNVYLVFQHIEAELRNQSVVQTIDFK